MERYILTEYDDASAETRAVYDDFLRTTGETAVPVWIKSLGHNAALARGYWERTKGTLFSGTLPLPLKEMIVFAVSAKHGARYCSACHARNVLGLDKAVSFDDLQAFARAGSQWQLPPYYALVVDFAVKVAVDANQLSDADFEKLRDEGFSKEEICEILAVIDLAAMFNIYTIALRLDLDPEYRAVL
jgi:uncharacterized peroxidase-related enzyme